VAGLTTITVGTVIGTVTSVATGTGITTGIGANGRIHYRIGPGVMPGSFFVENG